MLGSWDVWMEKITVEKRKTPMDIRGFGPFNLEVFAVFVGLTILLPWLL